MKFDLKKIVFKNLLIFRSFLIFLFKKISKFSYLTNFLNNGLQKKYLGCNFPSLGKEYISNMTTPLSLQNSKVFVDRSLDRACVAKHLYK